MCDWLVAHWIPLSATIGLSFTLIGSGVIGHTVWVSPKQAKEIESGHYTLHPLGSPEGYIEPTPNVALSTFLYGARRKFLIGLGVVVIGVALQLPIYIQQFFVS